jgi:hypothetical protein
MARVVAGEQHPDMDTLSMVLVAIGSLALLELAAANLRGDERRPRSTRSGARPPSRR